MAELNLADGGRLEYRDTGSGRPVVLLHGWAMRGAYFEHQVTALSPRYRMVVPDLRGHGASTPVCQGQGFATLVDDVCELLTTRDLDNAVLVGWSMGALVGWGVMGRPESARIAALVTIDMVPRLLNDAQWTFGLRRGTDPGVFAGAAARMIDDWPRYTRTFVPRIFARDRDRRTLIEQMIEDTSGNDPESMARMWLSIAGQDLRKMLPEIKVPCLVTYGARSQLYSEPASRWVAAELPAAVTACFEDSGHAPQLEEPELFNHVLEAFLADLPKVPVNAGHPQTTQG